LLKHRVKQHRDTFDCKYSRKDCRMKKKLWEKIYRFLNTQSGKTCWQAKLFNQEWRRRSCKYYLTGKQLMFWHTNDAWLVWRLLWDYSLSVTGFIKMWAKASIISFCDKNKVFLERAACFEPIGGFESIYKINLISKFSQSFNGLDSQLELEQSYNYKSFQISCNKPAWNKTLLQF